VTGPFGEPGLPPAAVRAFVDDLLARLFEFVPEADRAAAVAELLQEFEERKGAKPAKPGESIVFGDAAAQLLHEAARRALDEMRAPQREPDDG
jgi:hypothetical protein